MGDMFCCFGFQLIAKGKNASELFPAVVKNVASKNIEVRQRYGGYDSFGSRVSPRDFTRNFLIRNNGKLPLHLVFIYLCFVKKEKNIYIYMK